MRFFYLFLILTCASCEVYAQGLRLPQEYKEDIPEWDIPRLSQEATRQGWTYTPRASWVTEHLRLRPRRGLQEITGLDHRLAKFDAAEVDDMAPLENLPSSWDWRQYAGNRLQPIRNQGSCGSCWSFSITAVVESLVKIFVPEARVDLAEQTLVSSCESGGSCAGGFFTAFNYVRDKGLPDEKEDPYRASNSSCKSGLTAVAKISRWAYIGSNPTTEQIKTAMTIYGPISVDVNGSFGSYGSGIYNRCGSTGTNHMVTLEGWQDDPAYAANGGGYWIMRNSWGSNWGEAGYMRIVYKSTSGRNCNGLGNYAAYAVLDQSYLDDLRAKVKRINVDTVR